MYAGIDLGGTNIAVGLVEDGRIICKDSIKTNSGRGADEIIADMAEMIKTLCEKCGKSCDDIESIGIGAPGTPDKENGIVSNVHNITDEKLEFRKELGAIFNKPVFIENDARCAALGEMTSGAAKGYKNAIMVTLGTGVGGGIIIDGKLQCGCNYGGGEIGHMTVAMDGEPCKCGERGCYEQYASATALVRIAKREIEKNKDNDMYKKMQEGAEVDGRFIFGYAHENNPLALSILDEYTRNVGVGIVNLVNIFQPEIIVVGGGVSAQGDFLLNPIREYVRKHAFTKNLPIAEIKAAELGNDAGIIGAAMLKE